MNDLGREKLVAAALSGVKQIKGTYASDDGVCAMGALGVKADGSNLKDICREYGIGNNAAFRCPICNACIPREATMIAHLNDGHGLDFLTIARKI